MKNNLLIIDTKSKLNSLNNFFKELANHNCKLHFLINKKNNFKLLDKYHIHKLLITLNLKKTGRPFFLILFYPVFLFFAFFHLLYLKYSQKINTIICMSFLEKLTFTPIAKILKLQIIWFELPRAKDFILKRLLKKIYIYLTRFTRIITFSHWQEQKLLNLGIKSKIIKIIPIGIKLNNFHNQENIFSQMAETDHKNFTKKFFTIGSVLNLNEPQKIEILFQAIKKCLTVIHHLQLIIIGDGKERKNLNWLAKKMDIDNLVWFVGEQKNVRRWYDNFDIYVVSSEIFDLENTNSCLRAMASKLPIIAPDTIGADDLINNNHNGLIIEAGHSEPLAQAIIKLQQNKLKRKQFGQNSLKIVETKNNLVNMVEKFAKITKLS